MDFYEEEKVCQGPPYGDGMYLHPYKSMRLELRKDPSSLDAFWLIAADRSESCARYVGSQGGRCNLPVKMYSSGDQNGSILWKLRVLTSGITDVTPNPAPQPLGPTPTPSAESPPLPSPSPASPSPASPSPQVIFAPMTPDSAAPQISAEKTGSGTVTIKVNAPGGGPTCSVQSVTFVYGLTGKSQEQLTVSVTSAVQGVQLTLPISGFYSIYAFGNCQGSLETTNTSPGISLYNQVVSEVYSPTSSNFSTLFSVRYSGFTLESFTSADNEQVCVNMLGLQPGGVCTILSMLPGSVIATGIVNYPSKSGAQGLKAKLLLGSSTTMTTLAQGLSQATTPVVEATETEETPENPPEPKAATNIQVVPNIKGCPSSVSAEVTWIPVKEVGVMGYTATCYPSGAAKPSRTGIVTGANANGVLVRKLAQKVEYYCSVTTLSMTGKPAISENSNFFMTGYVAVTPSALGSSRYIKLFPLMIICTTPILCRSCSSPSPNPKPPPPAKSPTPPPRYGLHMIQPTMRTPSKMVVPP